jgi:hypothetical protein
MKKSFGLLVKVVVVVVVNYIKLNYVNKERERNKMNATTNNSSSISGNIFVIVIKKEKTKKTII